MKKLMIILLVGMLSLGLSGVVYAENQSISVTISTSVSLTAPVAVTSADWTLSAVATNTKETTATVAANCPYDLTVRSTGGKYMTGNDSDTTPLGAAFQLLNYTTSNTVTSYDARLTITDVATSADTPQILFSEPEAPAEGSDTVGVQFSQVTVLGDPAYDETTQIEYSITLIWTAAADLS